MQYAEYPLTDHGFFVHALVGPGEIWGLDNRVEDDDDQRFHHLGVDGHPSGAVMVIDVPGLLKTKTLALFPDGATLPEGGTEIPAAAVVDLLVAEYGWPVGTTLVDGIPYEPEVRPQN